MGYRLCCQDNSENVYLHQIRSFRTLRPRKGCKFQRGIRKHSRSLADCMFHTDRFSAIISTQRQPIRRRVSQTQHTQRGVRFTYCCQVRRRTPAFRRSQTAQFSRRRG
jgi:hypothetical protein